MAVRPFYLEARVDGRKTDIGSGPKSKSGEMFVTVYQREEGSIRTAVRINCTNFTSPEGKLMLRTCIFNNEGTRVAEYETEY